MTGNKIVLTSVGSHEEALNIARALVDQKLAACVNVISGVDSIYRWEGKIEQAKEWLLMIKTTADAFERVRDKIKELHSYELPECVCIGIEDGDANYLKWIAESVK